MNEIYLQLSHLDLVAADANRDGPTSLDPDAISALCEQLANSLLGIGATGPAARWRTLSIVGPSPSQLAPALDHTRQELRALGLSSPSDPAEQDLLTAAHRALEGKVALPQAGLVADWARSLLAAGDGAAALALLERSGAQVTVLRVPGSFELPVVAKQALLAGADAVVALGVIVRGGTPHFEYVSSAATDGLTQVALETGKAVGFGVLTVDTEQQGLDRAGLEGSSEDKGAEAAQAAIHTALVLHSL